MTEFQFPEFTTSLTIRTTVSHTTLPASRVENFCHAEAAITLDLSWYEKRYISKNIHRSRNSDDASHTVFTYLAPTLWDRCKPEDGLPRFQACDLPLSPGT
jgi:hypothetical protein